ncbi:MAG TPA: sodium:proton antiporter [Thermoguttaceae bacterium]|nr:sodium:proton antiporter [Thermoguttaceae bacterium]
MSHSHGSPGSDKPLLLAIAVVLALYLGLLAIGLPQKWTRDGVGGEHTAPDETVVQHAGEEGGDRSAEAHEPHGAEPGAGGHGLEAEIQPPPLWMVAPFLLLLGSIAVFPLLPWTEHWWESNLSRCYVAVGLGCLTLLYYLVLHGSPVEQHWPRHSVVAPSDSGLNFRVTWAVLANAILNEYLPFIMLLFSLYTISGGIRIEGDLGARPWTNTLLIAAGGLLASFIGTTGAAMLLIRPLLEANRERKHVCHTVIFFIFVVCNCGGCLLPIGDPPLFLGYLRGVDFLWTFKLWPQWLLVNGILLAIYFAWDHFSCYPREELRDVIRDEKQVRGLRFSGLWPNAPLLLGVVLSIALLDPGKTLPGTDWHPWYCLREIAQVALVALSLIGGSRAIRLANGFTYDAMLEVAALFFGIFLSMQAPLQILNVKGPELGLSTPTHFFWLTGSLSSLLDNAPAYVVFFETAKTLPAPPGVGLVAGVPETLLLAVSLGAVFMGAMTYIGNGPNFMVKAIAEKSGVRMPSFFGYMLYSCAILLPVLILHMFVFL